MDTSTISSPLMDVERMLGFLLGLHASSQARSTPISTEEVEYDHWLNAEFFAGGLQVLQPQNPFEEEKGESRTPSSCTTTPGEWTTTVRCFNRDRKRYSVGLSSIPAVSMDRWRSPSDNRYARNAGVSIRYKK